MTTNDEVASLLEEMADLLDAQGVEYKPTAYRRAAENVREYPEPVSELATDGEDAVGEIDRVGEAIAAKIVEYVETGEIAELEALREELPVDMAALTAVEGVGPKSVGKLYEALGITTLDELEAAAEAGEIQEVSGFGAKTEENILAGIDFARQTRERSLLGDARPLGESIRDYLLDHEAVQSAELAGSNRRWKETIGDVDVLVGSADPDPVVEAFLDWEDGEKIESGPTKASLRGHDGIRVDLRVVDPSEFGAALQYFTGSREHNIHVRNLAIARDLKVNEYGVFDISDVDNPDDGQRVGERIAGETEESVYAALDLPLIPPEMREDTGELEAAAEGDLPDLVETSEIRADLHTHSDWSDGNATIEEMARGAADFGHDCLALTDHGEGPGVFGNTGLDPGELREQMDAVAEVRETLADEGIALELFHGIETNITADGDLSTPEDLLDDLDVVVASPHAALDQDRETATERLVAAVEHPQTDILGHPTGRLINQRKGLSIDYERIAEAAVDAGTALEVNANPHRLDLSGEAVRIAVEAGATISTNTDAHHPRSFDVLRYGVHTARRGWAETTDVLNTRSPDEIRSFLDG
jgi:DNA polymerase (family 10)